jgi:mannose-6-phosphate isomerase-like protein (cupin superfamily)
MKKLTVSAEGANYSAINIGELNNLMDYSFLHPKLNTEVKGKVFIGEILKSTGAEVSFQILPSSAEMSFIHQHRKHEELYIFLKGKGQFQVDEDLIDVKEGTIIRIAPDGQRTWRNNSESPMIFMVIQTQAGSLDHLFIGDGFRIEGKALWNK